VLQITPGSTNPQFTERGCGTRFVSAAGMTNRAWSRPPISSRTTRQEHRDHPHKTTYRQGLADETRSAINAAGVQEKLYEAYNKGDKDFAALVSRFKKRRSISCMLGYYARPG